MGMKLKTFRKKLHLIPVSRKQTKDFMRTGMS